jgi:alkaline phosphatase
MIAELLDFDASIQQVINFADKNENTLVVVTADHETGGMAINPGSKFKEIVPGYTTNGHTATMIPVFAYGPGSELFSGIYENTEIYHKIRQALQLYD